MKTKDVADEHKYNKNLYFLMNAGVWIIFLAFFVCGCIVVYYSVMGVIYNPIYHIPADAINSYLNKDLVQFSIPEFNRIYILSEVFNNLGIMSRSSYETLLFLLFSICYLITASFITFYFFCSLGGIICSWLFDYCGSYISGSVGVKMCRGKLVNKHKYNPVIYFLMKFGVLILFYVLIISFGLFIWNSISKAFLSGGYFIDSPVESFIWRASLFLMMYFVFFKMIHPFYLWLENFCQKYKYGSVDAEMYEKNQTKIEEVENYDEVESKFQSAQHEYWTQWKIFYKSDLTYEEWKERINTTIVFKDANHDL